MRRQTDATTASSSSTAALTPFPSVEHRVNTSTESWARDLRTVFDDARDRFSDISWESDSGERVWAHKGGLVSGRLLTAALVYVRAPSALKS